MRKNLWLLLCAVLAMFTTTSCMQEEELSSTTEEIEAVADIPEEVKGFASKPIEEAEPSEGSDIWWVPKTRGLIIEKDDDIAVWWDTKEAIGVYGTRLTNSKFTGTNKYKSASTTSFSGGSLFSSPKYAYYPYNASNDSNSQTAVEGNIPQTQSYSTSINRVNYDYKIGTYKSRSLTGYNFTFSHIVTFVKFAVNTTGTKLEGEKLQSIKLTATGADGQKRQLWGDFTMNLTKAAASSLTCGTTDAECNTMTLKWSNTPTIYTNGTITGYMTTIPAVQKGDKLEFEVLTENYKATFTRTSEVDFTPNLLVTYPISLINMDDAVIENLNGEEEDEEDPVTPEEIEVKINSFKFTVAQNPGKILARELYLADDDETTTSREVTEVVCEVDNENRKIKAFIPYLNDRKLVPTFEHPDGLVMCTTSEIVTSGETEVDFSTELEIAIGDPNSSTNFAVYSIELTNTGLPVVVINQESGTTSDESNSDYKKASAAWYAATGAKWQPKDSDWAMQEGVDNFMVYNADGTPAITDKNGETVSEPLFASTRVRGNVTQQMPKKAFAVKLDKKSGVLDMPAHKRWVLLANWKDRTLMRNEVAFGMAKVFSNTFSDGIAWNPSGQHVELVYNGVHVGNYYLCEQIKIDGNRLDINDPYDKDNTQVGDPASYGYLLENDDEVEDDNSSNLMSTGSGDCWFYTKNYIPFIFKDDLDNDGNSSSAIRTYVQNFVRGVEDELYAGTLDESKLDVASFVDFLLLQELMLNSEMKHPKSCYMYINNGKIYGGPIWDFDWNTLPTSSSFSEEGYSYTQSMLAKAKWYRASSNPSATKSGDKNYVWYPMLVKNATFKAKAAERWNDVKGQLQAYAATIPAMAQKLAKSAEENDKIWKVDSKNSSFRGTKYGIGGQWAAYSNSAGYCGDEDMTFIEANTKLMNMLNERISGMSYVADQNWPNIDKTSGWGW